MTSRPAPVARRKPADERRTEMVQVAARVALADGLDRVTAKRIAGELGVFPGLVAHYFSADELVAAAFATSASAERDQVYDRALAAQGCVARVQTLLTEWLHVDRDPVSLLWLDAWQVSRRRPALLAEVTDQMKVDLRWLTNLIAQGISAGDFDIADATAAAMQILSLVDGLSVQAVVRGTMDYSVVGDMVVRITEQILGLDTGTLTPDNPDSEVSVTCR